MEQITLRLDLDLLENVKARAKSQSRSVASVIREALIEFLNNK